MTTEAERELCEICANREKIMYDLFTNTRFLCSERNCGCPGFVPGNIPKKVVE